MRTSLVRTTLLSASSLPGATLLQEPLPAFDLATVRKRVAKEHTDWSEQRLARAEFDYRRYLARCRAYRRVPLSPGRDADEVWHAHILHTEQYARDCLSYFGYFLHHRPFGDELRAENAQCAYDDCHDIATCGKTAPRAICACRDGCTCCDDVRTCTKQALEGSQCCKHIGNTITSKAECDSECSQCSGVRAPAQCITCSGNDVTHRPRYVGIVRL